MRIMQINSSKPTSQNKMTFKSKPSSAHEVSASICKLLDEATNLYKAEFDVMELASHQPPKSTTEALMRYPYSPAELDRQISQADAIIERDACPDYYRDLARERILAPKIFGKFSDGLVSKFQVLMATTKQALIGKILQGNPDESHLVRALKASQGFFHNNRVVDFRPEAHDLAMNAMRDVAGVMVARPDLDISLSLSK